MHRLVIALFASVLLFSGCVTPKQVVPDQSVPHQLAKPAKVVIWCVDPDKQGLVECKADVPAGWWVAGPLVVEQPVTP